MLKTIVGMLIAGTCVACGATPMATVGGTTYVVIDANNAVSADPNSALSSLSSKPQFVVDPIWQSSDPNVITSSPGVNLMPANDPNLCIDIVDGSANPNTLVQTWACNGFDPAQAWFLYKGQLHTQAGLCLDTVGDDVTQATRVVTQPCDNTLTRPGQLWNLTAGMLQITDSQRCLSLDAPGNGAVPQLAPCSFPDTRQHWVAARSNGAHVRGAVISTAITNSACLFVADSTNDGTKVTLRACDFGVMEQFVIEGNHLRALGKCVQAANVLGSSLTIEPCTNDLSQQWQWSNGALHLASDFDKCVGLVNSSTADDAPVLVQACSGNKSQQWSLGTSSY